MALSLVEAAEKSGLDLNESPSGDAAFTQLYLRFMPRLTRFVYRRTGDQLLAEDLAQETLIRAVKHFDSFDHTLPMWPWLKAIASNLAIDHARKSSREVLTDRFSTEAATHPVMFESGALMQAIETLPRRQKIAVALRYLDDWEPREIADFLGLNRTALEQLLFRARRKLRTEYSRLSESALGVAILKIRSLRRLTARLAEHARNAGSVLNPAGAMGADMTAQIATGLLAVVAGLAATGSGLTSPPSYDIAHLKASSPERLQSVGDGTARRAASGIGPAGGSSASSGSVSNKSKVSNAGIDNGVGSVPLPGDEARQPEDASITSVVLAEGRGQRSTAYAAGQPLRCGQSCSPALFRSTDGGESWQRLAARGFFGRTLLAPPNPADTRIFAMGSAGLQVSLDGGQNFIEAAPSSPFIAGSAAISPAFNRDDPSILIGTETLLRYDDNTRLIAPHPVSLLGPLNPAFAPNYPRDKRILIGATAVDPSSNRAIPTVNTCIGTLCTEARVGWGRRSPHVRPAPNFGLTGVAFAFTRDGLFASTDGALSFERVETGWTHSWLLDVVPTDSRVFAALSPYGGSGSAGIYTAATPRGDWHRLSHPLLDRGVRSLAVSGDRIVAALEHNGLACSTDSGRTWSRRCR